MCIRDSAEDAAGEAFGIEWLESVHLLACAREFDGAFGDFTHRECGAAAGVAVELSEDDAGDLEGVVEVSGNANGLLAGGGVGDEEDLAGLKEGLEVLDFLDEGLVDLLAAGSIKNLDIAVLGLSPLKGEAGAFLDVLEACLLYTSSHHRSQCH